MQWRNLYERFPGALPSQLLKEDIGMLTRPFVAGNIHDQMKLADGGQLDKVPASSRKEIEELIREVRQIAKKQKAVQRARERAAAKQKRK